MKVEAKIQGEFPILFRRALLCLLSRKNGFGVFSFSFDGVGFGSSFKTGRVKNCHSRIPSGLRLAAGRRMGPGSIPE